MPKTWRYFRVEGDPSKYTGENLFTVVIHHGGRFYSNLGLNKEYKGGEILYVDGVDADKISLTQLNSWAYDIGYCEGPITFQYKISGCGFVQIEKDCHVVDMFAQAPESERCIDIYICCLAARKNLEELEAETNPIVDHEKFNGHIIPDIEEEHEVMNGGVTVNHVLNDDDMMQQTFWEAFQNVQSRECCLYNFIQFKEKRDMKDPSFLLGMLFVDAELFKRAVRKHVVMTKKELRFQKNYKHKVAVVCKTSENCPWYLYASSEDKDDTTVQVKVYRDIHTCCTVGKRVFHCGATFVAGEYGSNIMGDEKWSRQGIQNAVTKNFGEVPPQVGRLQKKFYGKSRCGFCKELGHNARTCKKKNLSDVSEVEVQGEEPSVQVESGNAYVMPKVEVQGEEPSVEVNPPDEPNEPDVQVQVNPPEEKILAQRKKYTSQETTELAVENEPDVGENNPHAPRTNQRSPGKRKKKPTSKMQSPFINPCRPKKSKESQK